MIKEVGDDSYPLVIDTEKDIDYTHHLVGSRAIINHNAQEIMSTMHGDEVVVGGVIVQDGEIRGLEVISEEGRTMWAPIKDFDIIGTTGMVAQLLKMARSFI